MPSLPELLLKELDTEMPGTRRLLERVPEGKNSWKPHPKSMELGYLAGLTATMPGWIASMVNDPQLDLADPKDLKTQPYDSTRALVAAFDAAVAKARKALQGTTEAHLLTTRWKLMMKDQELGNDLRYDAIRVGAINHLCHHRAQLGIYLRLNEEKLPSLYGPSADEMYPGSER
jgi:uncharacterized damage-inducible protein DinB